MLYLFLDNVPDFAMVANDVEKEFSSLKIPCNAETIAAVKMIDNGELIDSNTFVDRFGYRLYSSELSTGCKAAICVLISEKIINIAECGLNARDYIITKCLHGSVVMNTNSATISSNYCRDQQINVCVDNKIFTNLNDLNDYISNQFRPER